MIRRATLRDARAIAEIYNYYIENTVVTFEEQLVSEDEMQQRIKKVLRNNRWFVFEEDGDILGYAYADEFKSRYAYRYALESTVYIKHRAIGKGIGTKLYAHLLDVLKTQDVHVVIAGIAIPNEPSIVLHEKFGFKKVAHFEEVGYKQNRWIDVEYWQYTF